MNYLYMTYSVKISPIKKVMVINNSKSGKVAKIDTQTLEFEESSQSYYNQLESSFNV